MSSDSNFSIAPIIGAQPIFTTPAPVQATPVGSGPAYGMDQVSLTGGVTGNAAVMAAEADRLMASPNLQDRYNGLITMARLAQVDPTAGMMRLQQAANVPGQDPNVVAFATRYLSALQSAPQGAGIQTLGQMNGTPQMQPASQTFMQPNPMGAVQGYPQTSVQPNPMGAVQGYPQTSVQPNPMGAVQGYPQTSVQPNPMAAVQGYSQAASQTYMQPNPMGAVQGYPQTTAQPGMMASPYTGTAAGMMPGGALRSEDAAILLQGYRADLNGGGPKGIQAVRQLAQLAQSSPDQRENVFRLLLNHIYSKSDVSVGEAINALVGMNDPRALPYIAAAARNPSLLAETQTIALNALKVATQQTGVNATPGTGKASIEYVRAMELELKKGGPSGVAAVQELRQALAPDPTQQSAIRNEVTRALLTYLATGTECTAMNAVIQLLVEMRSRESLRYLDATSRNPGLLEQTKENARAAVRTIIAQP